MYAAAHKSMSYDMTLYRSNIMSYRLTNKTEKSTQTLNSHNSVNIDPIYTNSIATERLKHKLSNYCKNGTRSSV